MMRLTPTSIGARSLYAGHLPEGVQDWVRDRELALRAAVATDGEHANIVYWRAKGSPSWAELLHHTAVEDIDPRWR